MRATFAFLTVVLGWAVAAQAELKPAAHPFMLWTKDEAAAIKKRIDGGEPWVKASLEKSLKEKNAFTNLFRYAVMGDEKAGEEERKFLLSFIGAPVNSRRWSTNYLSALRYDVLYDTLTPEQREKLRETFKAHIQHELDNPYRNTQTSWLPNMQMPRIMSANIMAVALQDEKLIDAAWQMPSSFKFYMDDYLADGGLYFEEFAKMTSLIGEFQIYADGLERLGLNEKGWGYKGKGGATLRNYVESYLWIGYPRTELPGGMPRYERVAMGDARGHALGVFQHANVGGAFPPAVGEDGKPFFNMSRKVGAWELWYAANMNGRDHRDNKVTKLQFPQWFERMHVREPDGPWGYFLAQMREPGEKEYVPTIFWGATPIDAAKVTAPAAPSRIFNERGFAMLRMEESAKYWESPAPAVALQFAQLYVHYTADCFSILGYHQFNRPVYLNRCISAGYNGGPWDFHVRGHAGVVVDGLQAQPVGVVATRHNFAPEMKYVHVNSTVIRGLKGAGEVRSSDQPKTAAGEIYPGVTMARSLVLTGEYLADVFTLKSETPRSYHWLVHAPGVLVGGNKEGFKPTEDLNKTLLNVPELPPAKQWVLEGLKRDVEVTLRQDCVLEDVSKSQLGKAWYDRQLGVKLFVVGAEEGTRVFAFETPTHYKPGAPRSPKAGEEPKQPETGGISVALERVAARTTFVVVHEPYEKNAPRIEASRQVWQEGEAHGLEVTGPGYVDYVFVDNAVEPKPIRVRHRDMVFTFTGQVYIRRSGETVTVRGEVGEATWPEGKKVVVNGK